MSKVPLHLPQSPVLRSPQPVPVSLVPRQPDPAHDDPNQAAEPENGTGTIESVAATWHGTYTYKSVLVGGGALLAQATPPMVSPRPRP